jgi:hypothetical protein
LRQEWLTQGFGFTSQLIMDEAMHLEADVRRVSSIVTPAFYRGLTQIMQDAQEAGRLLQEAGQDHRATKIDSAKQIIGRLWRQMKLWDYHLQLEEFLFLSRLLQQRTDPLSHIRKEIWNQELQWIHYRLTSQDTLTGKRLEEDAPSSFLYRVVPHVHLAQIYLMRQESDGGPDISSLCEELQAACEPLR